MVVAQTETGADVIFVIEGTAINGAYLGDLRTNYIVPALEFFNQGTLEEREYGCESATVQYGIIVYHAADRLPSPITDIYGPYSNPHRFLQTLDKIEFVGGGGESHAHIAEGLAAALQCLDDLTQRRDNGSHAQKHCILICNSPPYLMPVIENQNYTGNTAEQMASILNEKGIHFSILSPRKIPALYKLFEKSGGDLGACQTKNYAKDPRNLVLLKGFSLKERPVSPTTTAAAAAAHLPIGMPSPLPSHGSPMAQAPQPQPPQPVQAQPQILTSVAPNPAMVVGAPPSNTVPQGRGYPPAYARPNTPQANRWPMMPPQGPRYPDSSALIAQLSRPPNVVPPQFSNAAGMAPSPGQPQQQQVPNPQVPQQAQQQQQIPNSQVPQQQQSQAPQQQANQMRILNAQQGMGPQGSLAQQQQGGVMPPSTQGMIGQPPNVAVVMSQPGMINQNPQMAQSSVMQPQPSAGPGMPQQQGPQTAGSRERQTIWQGVIEWIDKKTPNDVQKTTRHVPCQVSTATKDGEPELKADSWPQKLIMQLMPKQLIGSIGGSYLKNSKSVLFHLTPSEALEALTKVMSSGFAGCVHFNSVSSSPQCDIKVLILLYTAEKRAFLGFIPNDQVAFVDRLRRVIQHSKSTNAMNRQGQGGQGGNTLAPVAQQNNPQTSMAGMLQNPMSQPQGQPINSNMGAPVVSQPGQQMMSQMQGDQNQQQQGSGQPGSFNNPLVEARQENLVKIQRLRQNLEAAQQQELQYKNQLEIMNQMKMQHQPQPMQDAVGMHPGQSQDQFKQQLEMTLGYQQEQQKQLRAQLQQMQAQQAQQQQAQQAQQLRAIAPSSQAGPPQRILRPNNPGLRHLLQQPQYRINMQPQMPRATLSNQPGQQPQNPQQFDEVGSYDFLGN